MIQRPWVVIGRRADGAGWPIALGRVNFAPMQIFADNGALGPIEDLIAVHRPRLGLRALIAIHDARRGPAFGGIRRRPYEEEGELVADASRLASAMSLKLAYAGLPAGGAKTVIWDRPGLELEAAYREIGTVIERLGGRYTCGPDVGSSERELRWLRAETAHVDHPKNDACLATARGVFAGLAALVTGGHEGTRLSGRHFVVQGLGGVGCRLAGLLVEAGAQVTAGDVAGDARARAQAVGAAWCEFHELWSVPADVFVPCALGGLLDVQAAQRLSAAAVCGAANNIHADQGTLDVLGRRGIRYVPDYAVNVGAVAQGVFARRLAGDRSQIVAAMDELYAGIARRVSQACQRAAQTGRPLHEIVRTAAVRALFPEKCGSK